VVGQGCATGETSYFDGKKRIHDLGEGVHACVFMVSHFGLVVCVLTFYGIHFYVYGVHACVCIPSVHA